MSAASVMGAVVTVFINGVHVCVIGGIHLFEDGGGSLLGRVSLIEFEIGLRRLFGHVTKCIHYCRCGKSCNYNTPEALDSCLELQAPCMTQGAPMLLLATWVMG